MSALELVEVVKHYATTDETIRAVDGVSLDVQPGEFVAIYGPSGSGKTTLLLLAAAILAPDAGRVSFEGRDLGYLSERERSRYRRERLGIVFQSFHLMPGASALENAALKPLSLGWRLRDAEREGQLWLERLGLGHRLRHRAVEMSMGERQRVALARALANGPRLLLADEPTGNLDSRRSREALSTLSEICHERQMATLLVTHDPQASCFVDRAYTLRDGALSEGLDIEPYSASHS